MRKKFTNLKDKRKKNSPKTVEPSKKEENIVYIRNNQIYDVFDSWTDYTNWTLSDFVNILSMTNKVKFPVSIFSYDAHKRVFCCKDANNTDFSIILDYIYCVPQFVLTIEFSNESFHYTLNNKLHKNDLPKPTFTMHKKYLEDVTYIYTLENGKIEFKSINSKLNNEVCVDIFLLTVESKEITDKILKKYDFERMFNNLGSSSLLLQDLILVLDLTTNDLENLRITVNCKKQDIVFSKVDLSQNIIVETISKDDLGYYNVFKTGRVVFSSIDQNMIITINDLSLTYDDANCLNDLTKITQKAKELFKKISGEN